MPAPSPAAPRVLLASADAPATRLIREALEAFYLCQVDTTSHGLRAFEKALEQPADLFIFDLRLDIIPGPLLYDLLARAYSFCHKGSLTPPAVIYLGRTGDFSQQDEWSRDTRVKGLLTLPLTIHKLLQCVAGTLQPRPEMHTAR